VLVAALPLLAAAFTPEPPTTVNGQVLGAAEDFATAGPADVCLQDMVVSPRAGETVYVEYLGIHDARLRLTLADGTFVILTQGDSYRDQRSRDQQPAIERDPQRYYLIGEGSARRYQMVTLESDSDEGQYALFLSGTALTGTRSDEKLLDRLSYGAEKGRHCDREFGYGWDGAFWTNRTPSKPE
jgi:hypothetical protein